MEPELDIEASKDNETVVSDSPSQEEVAIPSKSNNCRTVIIVLTALLISTVIVGLSVGLTRPPALPHVAPIMDDSGNPGLEYKLAASISTVGGQGFFGDDEKLAYVDPETGCVQVITYDSEQSDPLCNNFEEISSISINDEYAVVAHIDGVEVWEDTDYSSWVPFPDSSKVNQEDLVVPERNIVIKSTDPGFGKKTAMFQNRVIVASDEHVFLYQRHGHDQWLLQHRWGAVGFDMNTEQTTLVVYTRTEVMVYDMSRVTATDSIGRPEIHRFRGDRIAAVVASGDDVHVVVDAPHSSFSITHVNAAYVTDLGMPASIAGDAIVSLSTGCLIDIASGKYYSIEVEDADEVFKVHAFGNRLSVFLSRDGENMVEVFEK